MSGNYNDGRPWCCHKDPIVVLCAGIQVAGMQGPGLPRGWPMNDFNQSFGWTTLVPDYLLD